MGEDVPDEVPGRALDGASLYDLIEHQVAQRFYDRDTKGIPPQWVSMVRYTLKSLGPKVLATRMVRDYIRVLYAPAANAAAVMGAP